MIALLQNKFTPRGILSAIIGGCLALITFYFIIISPNIILSIGWMCLVGAIITLIISIVSYLYIKQTEDYRLVYWLDGLRYLSWFVGNSLLWIAVCVLLSAMLLRFFGASFWILALCAGGFAVSIYTLQGLFFLRQVIWYRLCWTIPDIAQQVADNPDSAMLLSQRYALAIENNVEEVDYLGLIRLALRTPSAKIVEFDQLARKQIHLAYFPAESWIRIRALFPVFVVTTLLTLILFGFGWGILQTTAEPIRHYLEPLIVAQRASESTEILPTVTPTPLATAASESSGDGQGEGESQSESSGEGAGEGDSQTENDGDGQGEGDSQTENDGDGQGEGESQSESSGEGADEGDSQSDSSGDGPGEGESQSESSGEGQGEGESQSESSGEGQGEGDAQSESSGEGQGEGDAQSESSDEGAGEGDSQSESSGEGAGEGDSESESNGEGQGEADSQSDGSGEGQGEGESQSESSGEGAGEGDSQSDGSGEGQGEGESQSESSGEGQGEGESQSESSGEEQGEGDSQSASSGEGQGEGESQSESSGEGQNGNGDGNDESESTNSTTFGLGESTPMMSETLQPIPTPVASGINPADRITVDVPPMRDPSRKPDDPRDINEDDGNSLETVETADNLDATQEPDPFATDTQQTYQRIPNWILELTTKES